MKKFKRIFAAILAALMLVAAVPAAYADGVVCVATEYPEDYATYSGYQDLSSLVNIDSFKALISNGLEAYNSSINISSYNIRATAANIDAISDLIFNEMPEMFHVGSYSYSFSTATLKLLSISPNYLFSKAEYQSMMSRVESARDALLDGIIGNSALSDVEKALLIHDRLSLVCDYDYSFGENCRNLYGSLVLGSVVCQGYAETYDYLLEAVGMESYLCTSDALNHAWNIIKVGGEWYHVDVTWDDHAWNTGMRGAEGAVGHNYFLLSSDEIYKSHTATDYDTLPDDTTYDNYFWQSSKSAFHLVGDEIYYIDNSAATLNRYSDHRALCSVASQWKSSHGTWGNFARLSSNGEYLYFSLAKYIYKYDIASETMTLIFEPTLENYYNIYGFIYEDGYLVCDINDTPPSSGYEKSGLYQLKELYREDMTPPEGSIVTTNNLAASQKVVLRFSDEKGIAGYYWGTDSNYANNLYTETSAESATQTVSAAGTYYLVVMDTSGNLSEPYSQTFYQTTLDGNGASVSPATVITAEGKTFQFPAVEKEGHIYKGWAESPSAIVGQTSLMPTGNATYYAIFEEIIGSDEPLPGDISGNHLVDTQDAVLILRYLTDGETIDETLADFNGDGRVRISDVVLVLRYILNHT